MKIDTKYLGQINIDPLKTIKFPSGIPGFQKELEFVLLDLPGNSIFQTLQSLKTPELAFIVVNPYHFYKDYEFRLEKNLLETLQINDEQDVTVLVIVTLKRPFHSSTVNLKAPLIVNSNLNIGKQYVLNSDDFPIKAPIVSDQSKKMKGD